MIALADMFTDHAVLQRGKPVEIRGKAAPDSRVSVVFKGLAVSADTDGEGNFTVTMPSREADGKASVLMVSCGSEVIALDDIIYGDVFFAGGQSNMEWPLINAFDGERHVGGAFDENIRFINVPVPDGGEIEGGGMCWQIAAGEDAQWVSAVAYFAAKTVKAKTSAPIGIIDCYKGGTSISCWLPESDLQKSEAGKRYIADYKARMGGKTDAECNALYLTPNEDWPKPAAPISPFRPFGLYEKMITRIKPYALKGFWWYQGEEDAGERNADYAYMMTVLADRLRADFGHAPLLYVKLPPYNDGGEGWEKLKAAQIAAEKLIPDARLVDIDDCENHEPHDIHPRNKFEVGTRLGAATLKILEGENGKI